MLKDHLGNEFSTTQELCNCYGVNINTYRARRRKGWTMEERLTGKKIQIKDHLGNGFSSIRKMCRYWGIAPSTFRERKKSGCTLEECLTGGSRKVRDHLGNEYPTKQAMCEQYGIAYNLFRARLSCCGWTLEEALTKKVRKYSPGPGRISGEAGISEEANDCRPSGESV